MTWLTNTTLSDDFVSLVPLDMSHHDDLVAAATDGELWTLWYTTVPKPEHVAEEIERRLQCLRGGSMLPFTIIDQKSGKAVGMTTYMNVDSLNKRLEIGSTWYRKSVQRTGMNTRCKMLLLSHAFETLDCIAVEFRTHILNAQSRKAIERLGAKMDGILRNHSRAENGTLRDTCVFSIIESEWPTVKAHLSHQIAR
ncbi:MAG: GNAT family protein [Sneathiella sp.]